MTRTIVALLTLSLLVAVESAFAAEQIAPLPPSITPSGQAKVRGLYVEAEIGDLYASSEIESLEAACKDRGIDAEVERRDLLWKGKRRIYRIRQSIVIFEERPTVETGPDDCVASVSLRPAVIAKQGIGERTDDWIDPHMKKCGGRSVTCRTEKVAGVAARCVNSSNGFDGVVTCYSIQQDLSRDLILSRSTWDDTGGGSHWSIGTVLTAALIDPAVFHVVSEP